MYIVKDVDQRLLLQKLVPTKLLDGGWTQVFSDPDANSEWILFRHHSERQGGGQPVLRKNPVPEQLSEWMTLCLSSGNEDDILGLAWELSRDFEHWPDVLDWLEKNSATLSILHIRLFLNNLEILHVTNRRSIIGKNASEIEDDYSYFSNLARRAGKLIGAA
jgi:hypothetical protein